jgi:GR25 family glycosyltransferase involved in LPS biosynthesis
MNKNFYLTYSQIEFNINYYFDKIYVLNLEKHNDRKKYMLNEFKKYNINNYKFWSAINGNDDKYIDDFWDKYSKIPFTKREKNLGRKLIGSKGVLANLLSVRDIIIDAKKNNYKKILFLEDDVIFHKNFNEEFTRITSKISNNWKILYLGVQNKYDVVKDNIYIPNEHLSGGWSFGIDHTVYDKIINECNKKNMPFDNGPLTEIRKLYKNKCKVIYPNLIVANLDESSLRNDKRTTKTFASKFGWDLNLYNM